MSEYCAICGARIGDNNVSGIGGECMAALKAAQRKLFFSNPENKFDYYKLEASIVRKYYLNCFENTKFRSKFKKSFYESISNSEKVSRAQMEIMYKAVFNELETYKKMFDEIRTKQKEFIDNIYSTTEVSREAIEIARSEIRKNKKK